MFKKGSVIIFVDILKRKGTTIFMNRKSNLNDH